MRKNMTKTLAILQKYGIRDGVKIPTHNGFSSTVFARKNRGNLTVRWKSVGRELFPVYLILSSEPGWLSKVDAASMAASLGVNVRFDSLIHWNDETPHSSVVITPSGAEFVPSTDKEEEITKFS